MTNWTTVFDTLGETTIEDFVSGDISGRQLEEAARFTDAAGPLRNSLRTRGVNGTRQLARKALRRRKATV